MWHALDANTDTINSRETTHHFYARPVRYTSPTDYNRERAPLALEHGSTQLDFWARRVSRAALGRNDAWHVSTSSRTCTGVSIRESYSKLNLFLEESRG